MAVEIEAPPTPTPYEAFCQTLRSRGPTLNLLYEHARVSPEREGDTIVRDAFASAIIAVLHGMLRDYWVSLGAKKHSWKHAGPRIDGCSIGQVLSEAKDKTPHKKWAVLETLSGGSGYGALEALVREFAAELQNSSAR